MFLATANQSSRVLKNFGPFFLHVTSHDIEIFNSLA